MGRLLVLMLLAISVARATSIVILRSPTRIYVGADSRRIYRSSHEVYAGSVCKIVPAGAYVFAASGITYANDQQISQFGAEAGRESATLYDAMEEFRRRMEFFLPQALSTESRINRISQTAAERLVLEAAFMGFERGVASVSVEWFRNAANRIESDRRTYTSTLPSRYDFIFLGKRRAIDRVLLSRLPQIRNEGDAVNFIIRAINLEIAESPETTAAPIDIIELTPSSRIWLSQKPGCQTHYSGISRN